MRVAQVTLPVKVVATAGVNGAACADTDITSGTVMTTHSKEILRNICPPIAESVARHSTDLPDPQLTSHWAWRQHHDPRRKRAGDA